MQAWSTLEDLVQQSPAVSIPEASGNAIQRRETAVNTEDEGMSDRATLTPPEQPAPNPTLFTASTSSPGAWDNIADLLEKSTPSDSDAINRTAASDADAIDRVAMSDADAINRVATPGSDADVINRAITSSPHTIAPASATPDPFPNLHALDTPPPPIQRQTFPSRFTSSLSAPIQRLIADEATTTEPHETVTGAGDNAIGDNASGQLEKLAQVMYQKVRQRLAIERERMGRSGSGRFQ